MLLYKKAHIFAMTLCYIPFDINLFFYFNYEIITLFSIILILNISQSCIKPHNNTHTLVLLYYSSLDDPTTTINIVVTWGEETPWIFSLIMFVLVPTIYFPKDTILIYTMLCLKVMIARTRVLSLLLSLLLFFMHLFVSLFIYIYFFSS